MRIEKKGINFALWVPETYRSCKLLMVGGSEFGIGFEDLMSALKMFSILLITSVPLLASAGGARLACKRPSGVNRGTGMCIDDKIVNEKFCKTKLGHMEAVGFVHPGAFCENMTKDAPKESSMTSRIEQEAALDLARRSVEQVASIQNRDISNLDVSVFFKELPTDLEEHSKFLIIAKVKWPQDDGDISLGSYLVRLSNSLEILSIEENGD